MVWNQPKFVRQIMRFCDPDMKDVLRKGEDQFTMVAAPLTLVFIVLPWVWWLVKHIFSWIIWCCTWEIYVEEELDEEEFEKMKKNK